MLTTYSDRDNFPLSAGPGSGASPGFLTPHWWLSLRTSIGPLDEANSVNGEVTGMWFVVALTSTSSLGAPFQPPSSYTVHPLITHSTFLLGPEPHGNLAWPFSEGMTGVSKAPQAK